MNEAACLRLVQLGCTVLVLASMGLVYWLRNPSEVAMSARHWLVIAAALGTAIFGFSFQRRMVNRPARATGSLKSTPFTRWRAGHVVRLWTAMSVGLWAVLLCDLAGPRWMVNAFLAIALLFLLLWSPGSVRDR